MNRAFFLLLKYPKRKVMKFLKIFCSCSKKWIFVLFRIRVTRLLWLMPYFLLLAFHLKIGNSFFVFTTRTPFTSQTKWQMSYNSLYCENVEKLLPNRSIGFFTSMITLSICYRDSFKSFFLTINTFEKENHTWVFRVSK